MAAGSLRTHCDRRIDANDAEQQGRSILSNVPETDALFISCTNYRTLPALAALEKEFEIPVISSNAATIWDLCNRTGIQADLNIKLTKQSDILPAVTAWLPLRGESGMVKLLLRDFDASQSFQIFLS